MNTGAVILAAGHRIPGVEFGPMLPVGSTTVIKRIIITLRQAGVDPIVVVTGAGAGELEKHISRMRVICLRNEKYESTLLFDSIRLGLNYIEDLCGRVLVMPAGAPFLLSESIERLLKSRAPLACPVHGGKRGQPVLLAGDFVRAAVEYTGGLGLAGFLESPEAESCLEEIPVEAAGIALPLETEEDCAEAAKELAREKIPMHPRISAYLECDETFFGPGIAQFPALIGHTGSMQTACRQMHMSYSKGWKIIKTAQKQLGYPLLITQAGGAAGGFSELTPKARDFLERFLSMEQELKQEAKRLFAQYFGEGK